MTIIVRGPTPERSQFLAALLELAEACPDSVVEFEEHAAKPPRIGVRAGYGEALLLRYGRLAGEGNGRRRSCVLVREGARPLSPSSYAF